MQKEKYRFTFESLVSLIKQYYILPRDAEIIYVGVDYERNIVEITFKNVGYEHAEEAETHIGGLISR